jgi:hypothetical protein
VDILLIVSAVIRPELSLIVVESVVALLESVLLLLQEASTLTKTRNANNFFICSGFDDHESQSAKLQIKAKK